MPNLFIRKISNGEYHVILDGDIMTKHSMLSGAGRSMETTQHLIDDIIQRNLHLRDLLKSCPFVFINQQSCDELTISEISTENELLYRLALDLGLYKKEEQDAIRNTD